MRPIRLAMAPTATDRDGICASQTPAGAGAVTINGALASGGVATLGAVSAVTVYSASDISNRTFDITGTDYYGAALSETGLTGPNNSTVVSSKSYKTVTAVTISGAAAGAIEVGVNGTGKTTTIGKLARKLSEHGRSVLVGAADTFRAAAEEQLEIWAERSGADFVGAPRGADPAAVAYDAVEATRARGHDVAIIDTAGRLHTQANLMAELEKVRRVIEGRIEGAPHETLLVVDATTGQNGLQQAKLFGEAAGVTGVALTKLDGSARGGVAIAIAVELGLPVKLVGVGEGVDDLRPFDAGDYARALIQA